MKICRVQIENYRNLKHIDIELASIVALIGENNCGKSNFLRALTLPLTADDSTLSKKLSWYDINKEAKDRYYNFLKEKRESITNGSLTIEELLPYIPFVKIQLFLLPEDNEHYNVNEILINDGEWLGCIQYLFEIKDPQQLLDRVRTLLLPEEVDDNIQMSLLPMEFYDYSITVPPKGCKVSYDTLSKFRSVNLPAERDSFASNADKLGSKALSDLLQKSITSTSQAKIEKAYKEFFDTIKAEGNLDAILNWQDYSGIENAQKFFHQISALPNMPQMSSILGSIRLGYDEENMYMQGLGYRNLILMAVLLNYYVSKERDINFRLMTVEEPEAHLCVNNILLMTSLFNYINQKNRFTQIIFSTHNVEFVNKIRLENVVVLHNGAATSLGKELTEAERDYLAANPNTDIFKFLFSKRIILVEGFTEELLIKSYFQTRKDLNDIKVLSFHKGFTKIIDIWKKINSGSRNKLGIVRDFDNQPNAQEIHEAKQDENVIVRTTHGYTLETEITNTNYELLVTKYGSDYGWTNMKKEELQNDWRKKKSEVILRICHDLVNGEIETFNMPSHIQQIIDFMQGDAHEN